MSNIKSNILTDTDVDELFEELLNDSTLKERKGDCLISDKEALEMLQRIDDKNEERHG